MQITTSTSSCIFCPKNNFFLLIDLMISNLQIIITDLFRLKVKVSEKDSAGPFCVRGTAKTEVMP